MRSNPKIIVLKTREIIYTLLLLALMVLLIVCLVLMFSGKTSDSQPGGTASSGQNTSLQSGTDSSSAQNTNLQSDTNASSGQNTNLQSDTNASSGQNASLQSDTNASSGQSTSLQTDTNASSGQNASLQSDTGASSAQSAASQTASPDLETAAYIPGVYTTPVVLGNSTVDVEVTVDSSHINSIRLVNLSESTEAAFPLVSPSLDHITSQILEKQSLEGITCPSENRYTSQLLLSAVSDALALASASR